MQQLVVTAVGPDRPGLVDELAEALAREGGNIGDSRMINLRGRFAVVMLVEAADDRADRVRSRLAVAAEGLGLTATVQPAAPDRSAPAPPAEPAVPYRIRTYAMDQVGLVHRITHILHLHKINIEELDTRLQHAPHTGAPLFTMEMIVAIPHSVPLKRIRDELETLCAELNCDLDIDRA